MIFSKVTSLLGGRVRLILSGGAPLSPDTHEQIKNILCANVIQGYGLTETTSCATVMDSKLSLTCYELTHNFIANNLVNISLSMKEKFLSSNIA